MRGHLQRGDECPQVQSRCCISCVGFERMLLPSSRHPVEPIAAAQACEKMCAWRGGRVGQGLSTGYTLQWAECRPICLKFGKQRQGKQLQYFFALFYTICIW